MSENNLGVYDNHKLFLLSRIHLAKLNTHKRSSGGFKVEVQGRNVIL